MNNKALRVLEFNKIKDLLKEKASSTLGKKLVEALEPSTSYDEIKEWLNETSEINSMIIANGSFPIGPFIEMDIYLKRAAIGSFLYPGELIEVSDTLRTARRVKQHIKKSNTPDIRYPIFAGYGEQISAYKDLEDRINISIIGENELSDQASSTLASIRRQIDKKNQAIRNKLNSIITSDTMQKFLQDSLVTIRDDRFVVPVRAEHKTHLKGIVHDRSGSGNTLYIEPMAVVELNNDLKELRLKEKAEIEKILTEITAQVFVCEEGIKLNQKLLEKIDFAVAKGKLSVDMRGMAPALINERRIKLRNARHPFIDPKEVVPSNVWLGKDFTTLLITGPNTGGKTVTLKTVGLLVLMTQSGLHIPADHGTEMSVFSNVFADIGDEQSIEQSLSTFSSHMTNIVTILDEVDEDALVLFDELGAGTDPTEGAALAMAILSELYNRQIRTLATTHYSELKHYAFTKPGIENACVEFDVETLSPTYKLLIGVPGKSNAFEISKKLGLNEYVINNARALVDNNNIEFEDILSSIETSRKDAETERDEAIKLRLDAEKLKNQLQDKRNHIENRQDKMITKAKEEANTILKKAKQEADEIIKELRGLKTKSSKEQNKQIEEMRKKLKDGIDKTGGKINQVIVDESEIPKNLKVGEPVYIVNLDQKGEVASKPDNKGDLTVRVGIMKMKVNVKQVRRTNAEKKKTFASSKSFKSRSASISTSIDLRGSNYEDAIYELDGYLDDVSMSGLDQVTIIHGVGTGVLKSKLKGYFSKHPHVSSFREGEYGEGGAGVTIIKVAK